MLALGWLQARKEAEAYQAMRMGADIVVADEGHQIKNPKTARFGAMCSIETMRRVALTGYPLQNNMDEYYTMIQWCKKNILDDAEYFHRTWAVPIAEGDIVMRGVAPRAGILMCTLFLAYIHHCCSLKPETH